MQANFDSDNLLSTKITILERTPKIALSLTLLLALFTISSLNYYSLLGLSIQYRETTSNSSSFTSNGLTVESTTSVKSKGRECDIFSGEWVPNPKAPYYTNETCSVIYDHQNCMKFGRPDTEFMKWRWKPKDCDLPIFNPAQFLEIVRGKSMAFVGDSVARNHMQSLMCLLSQVTHAVNVSPTNDEKLRVWLYPSHNFTLANFWSPYLVKADKADPHGPAITGLFRLHLDVPDASWTGQIEEFDYVIVSAGHWFLKRTMYYEKNNLKGCHHCLNNNITELTKYYGYRKAFRTTFRALNSLRNFKGMTFLRTFAPSHFENGEWDKGGDCIRTELLRGNETRLDGTNLELYMTQLEEFKTAEREGRERGLKYRLLDITNVMILRPDGHPSRHGRRPEEEVILYKDCVHWCLPGPIDVWNDFLLYMLRMEE